MALSTNITFYGKNFIRFAAFLSNELREKSSFHQSSSKRKYSQKAQTPVPVKSAIVKELNKPLVVEEDGPGQKLKPGQVRLYMQLNSEWNRISILIMGTFRR